ncbi:hypothetical protein ACO0K9_19315 [Undibacterium sp. Ji50W]|uniref:hypothetical protein n=1 Tax=Undibacterium sp. Ji50W TaxID=3413041 RepID=UPI003BF2506D
MTSPKAAFKFQDYKGILPYSSELFGVYQPLLGWKSKRHERRFSMGVAMDQLRIIEQLSIGFSPTLVFEPKRSTGVQLASFDPGKLVVDIPGSRSLLIKAIRQAVYDKHPHVTDQIADDELAKFLDLPLMTKLLKENVATGLTARMHDSLAQKAPDTSLTGAASSPSHPYTLDNAKTSMEYEAKLAATILQLKDNKEFSALRKLFFPADWKQTQTGLRMAADRQNPLMQFVPQPSNPLDTMDPNFDLDRVVLSPIGIVHLFRQYFFELDTFLGSPVGHVWVSPGTSLELIEVSTRKVVVERSFEQSIESTKKSELDSTDQDELSDAVKQDNQQDIKFGAGVTASYAGVTATSNFDMHNTQKQARETTHKHMRQQSTKLSTEIKTNYKTTFKTVTETSDTSSKRYVIRNDAATLQNYELRRKMRQVAVQVQDIGTYLCWQTYVDTPGDTLELASLVHIAELADLGSIPHPDAPEKLAPQPKDYPIDFQYENTAKSEGHEMDVIFYNGDDKEGGLNNNDLIVWQRTYVLTSPLLGYTLDKDSLKITSLHSDVCVPQIAFMDASGKVKVALSEVNFADQPSVKLQISAVWNPPSQDKANQDYLTKMSEYTSARARAQKEAYNKAVAERITLASKIAPRPADDLREEERITIYRQLIQEMLLPKAFRPPAPGAPNPPVSQVADTLAARHVLSELINSIFDVDKMLYFVAPEWWKPRTRASQTFGISTIGPHVHLVWDTNAKKFVKVTTEDETEARSGEVAVADQVAWDAGSDVERKHYLITDSSASAKLGSSLGWVMQLDGDDLRNAFLNAPWVKAVMPIRPGKEKAALNWLKHVEGFNGIGPSDIYTGEGVDGDGKPLHGKPLVEVLNILAESVAAKHVESLTTKPFDLSDPQLPHDPDSTVTTTPVDRVWEHGFNPLKDGFQARPLADADGSENFATFDQWVEILPTDQVVPVVVEYDPRTGRLKDPAP